MLRHKIRELKRRKGIREREEKKKTAAASAPAKAQKATNDDDLPPHVCSNIHLTELLKATLY